MTALDAVEGEVNCRPCAPFKGRLGCGSRVLEQGEGRQRIIDALVAFFVAYGEVQVSVCIEVVQHGNGATPHIQWSRLESNGRRPVPIAGHPLFLDFPQRRERIQVVIDFQGDVFGEITRSQSPSSWGSIGYAAGNRSRKMLSFSGVRQAGKAMSTKRVTVLAIGGVFQHESAHGGVGDVGDDLIVEVFSVKLQRGNGASSVRIALVVLPQW